MPATAAECIFDSLIAETPNLMYQLRGEVAGLVAYGMAISEAAELDGIPVPDRLPDDPPFTPTPAMTRVHCFRIQNGWTATEWRGRQAVETGEVQMPVVRVRDLRLDG